MYKIAYYALFFLRGSAINPISRRENLAKGKGSSYSRGIIQFLFYFFMYIIS